MVNAGIIPATVTITDRAKLWANVLPDITPQPNLVIADEGTLALAMRKNNPKLKEVVDEFVKGHMAGTSFGNTLMRRYLQNTKWITNPTTKAQLDAFNQTVAFFKKYASQYDFDYLLVVAQGYQESMLNQAARTWRCGWHHAGQAGNSRGRAYQHPRRDDRREQHSCGRQGFAYHLGYLFQRSTRLIR